jgi:DNA modification methylase
MTYVDKKKLLEKDFQTITGVTFEMDKMYENTYENLCAFINKEPLDSLKERKEKFIALLNRKFDLNAEAISKFYSLAASLGYTFNFHVKKVLEEHFNKNDKSSFKKKLQDIGIEKKHINELLGGFTPISSEDTLKFVRDEIQNPTKLRVEKGVRDIGNEIAKSMFSGFIWASYPEELIHSYFDPHYTKKEYRKSFWKQLQINSPELFNRKDALHILRLTKDNVGEITENNKRHRFLTKSANDFFTKINNHGYLAVIIESANIDGRFMEWEVASDLILIAEKFKEEPLDKGYFQWKKISEETNKYIPKLNEGDGKFELINEGFTYRDTFVLTNKEGGIEKLLIIFQKNDRDETVIPCPACRSIDVRGNSYSSFGVKSWECQNPLCPDRSKYNRGKRYSFKGLLMQEAIQEEGNAIPKGVVRRWQKDVVKDVSDEETIDMLIRHYSMSGDTIHIHNWDTKNENLGRKIIRHTFALEKKYQNPSFFDSNFTKRYLIETPNELVNIKNLGDDSFKVFCGNSASVLKAIENEVFDGAVTSPPYYNAREYSQWPNMYCYLHDIFNIHKELYRTLKEGAIYLYNIFDYFDNENIVTSSAMGQKRMILSAYTVDLFRRVGFELVGNIPWYKGDIEGKRGFNAGNFTPFYQSPFNCWEHILIFRKPHSKKKETNLTRFKNRILECKPVFKMVKGINIHGHTAPYPDEIPRILIDLLPPNSTILDPFAGSLTTGRVAERTGHKSVNIEMSKNYCELGLNMRNAEIKNQRIDSLSTLYKPSL